MPRTGGLPWNATTSHQPERLCFLGKYAGTGEDRIRHFLADLLPHGQKDIRLDLPEIPDDGNEYFLNLYAYTKTASGLLPAGYEVAKEQLKLGKRDFFARMPGASGNLEYRGRA